MNVYYKSVVEQQPNPHSIVVQSRNEVASQGNYDSWNWTGCKKKEDLITN